MGFIAIPLRAVIARLPGDLQAKILCRPESAAVVRVSANTILEQLPHGSVRITLAELTKASPPGVFAASLASCPNLVELPLQEILPRLKPSQLSRRPNQKRVQVSADITPIFGTKGEHLVPFLTPIANKNGAASLVRANLPAPSRAAPASINGFPTRREPAFVSPTGGSSTASTAPNSRPAAPGAPVQPVTRPIPSAPRGSLTVPGSTAPPPLQSAGKDGVIQVPLEVLIRQWPEPVLQEIAKGNLARCTVALPVHDVEPALRRGKIVVAWKQVRAWLGPSAAGPASVHDELALELRLSAIVPLFLAQRRPARSQRLATVAPSIPNLFSGPAPAPTAPPEAVPSVTSSVPALETTLAPTAETSPASQDLGHILGQPEKRHWTPMEIVQRATHLEGVTGVVLALQDGLLVASELPPDINGDAIAAFLPQMHSRVAQCTKEINLGEPSRITLVLDRVPLLMVKAGRIFLAALGRAGHDLPESTLTAIATQLGKLSK